MNYHYFAVVLVLVSIACTVAQQDGDGECARFGLSFFNWDKRKSCMPFSFRTPSTDDEVVKFLRDTHKDKIQIVGSGMSFSGIQLSDNAHMVSLHNMNKILHVEHMNDKSGDALVDVQAGIRIRDLVVELGERNLALLNLGATANQTIAGAISTGTHGTGQALGALGASVRGIRLITATGEIMNLKPSDGFLFQAAVTGLGRLGIITALTLYTVPQFKMRFDMYDMSFTQLKTDLPEMKKQHPRLQWSFKPYTDNATMILRDSVDLDAPIEPAGPDGGCWSNTQKANPCTDVSYKTLTDSASHFEARSLYTEMEMFIPVEHTLAAIDAYIKWMDTVKDIQNPDVTKSVMVRYVAADDLALSPMSGRDTAVISFIVSAGDKTTAGDPVEFARYSQGLQELCETKFQGRPHWGKVNWVTEDTPAYLSSAYPGSFDTFVELSRRLDPEGRFLNPYLAERGL